MASKVPAYTMGSSYGDVPKGLIVYLSLHHQPRLDGHRMVTRNRCGKGAAYSVPEGILVPTNNDED